jgi:negative regulator of flagellin synthesis FlgM
MGALAHANRATKTDSGSIAVPGKDASSGLVGADKASLSSTAGVVAQALAGSDVRAEKVAALQQSIAAGTYSVSSSDVADKLMSALLK